MKRTLAIAGMVLCLLTASTGCESIGVWKDSVRDRYSSARERYANLREKVAPYVAATPAGPLAEKADLVLRAADRVLVATDRIRAGECAEVDEEVIEDACSKVDQVQDIVAEANESVAELIEELETVDE